MSVSSSFEIDIDADELVASHHSHDRGIDLLSGLRGEQAVPVAAARRDRGAAERCDDLRTRSVRSLDEPVHLRGGDHRAVAIRSASETVLRYHLARWRGICER